MVEQNLRAVAFPILKQSQIAALSRCVTATLERYNARQTLFSVGRARP
jgi:hypothetical protein